MSTQPRRRERRRKSRYTGVLRDQTAPTLPSESLSAAHGTRRDEVTIGWRLFSALIVLVCGILLTVFFTADAFYVRGVTVEGNRYMPREEVFAFADVAGLHVFWVEAATVRENILRSPSVADALVRIGWPPNMIRIQLEEREPALVWEQGQERYWIGLRGRIMPERAQRDDLMRIVSPIALAETTIASEGWMAMDVVNSALQLDELLPDVARLRYDAAKGLGYINADNWEVWFGVGQNMLEKVRIYQTIAADLRARGLQPREVNVVDPDHPFYNTLTAGS